ncbi:sn-glycerol-3-phosphate import ATP-binding protein UgpC [Thalassospira alkalitolerans]|mgnify:FL=1|uniref:Glycerol-3-phosphate ABC transporter ATP-binding protein n=1 Tax=Thalassospira alkalitolerans TaxID=1293890 RepID=A0A1Y2LCJ7_9PROT|nr:sn-glycerol-3-phosphate import ATP-binding protein UgpC [Thalassospira alkalitolerans]OSQ48633.1 glycerol-3-phosphate ABC transporter ATP-binding protein [Thalassospira alkalitolerans]|tara:strand:- start:178604 stop:179674 length:1071 start_codon:yes stop_codon:yes gene_type:complete
MATVTLNQAEKTYPNGFKALHGIDLEIGDGEFTVLVGPSGCGKSTLLRMIAGLESISGGEIKIDDRVVNNVAPADRDIAMVFQNYALYPHMTNYGNMAYGLKNRGYSKAEIDTKVRHAASILQLDDHLDRKPQQLSGGQRQRVAMGRAIVREPKVFLFDEPLSNLDAKLRVDMRLEIKNLQQRLGITSVYVTHDQVEAMTLADRLIVMNAGIAEQIGSPIEIYEKPASLFVASFIGSPSMNFLDGKVSDDKSHVVLGDGSKIDLDHKIDGGRELVVGVRPEHFTLIADGSGAQRARVRMIESLGAETLVYLEFGDKGENVTLRMQGTHQFTKGQELALSTSADLVHLFDKDSGKRL